MGEKNTPVQSQNAYASSAADNRLRAVGAKSYAKGSWFVQAGAYSKMNSAQQLAQRLNKVGDTNVYFVEVDGQKFYRVRVGPYSDRSQAEAALSGVKETGVYNAAVVKD